MGAIDAEAMCFDPAIDLEATVYGDYWDSLFDSEKLVFKTGEQPSWFTIQPMTTAQKIAAPPRDKLTALQRAAFVVRCGLTRIDGYTVVDEQGNETAPPQPVRRRAGNLGELATEEWLLEESQLSEREIRALALMIEHISEAQAPLPLRSAAPGTPSDTKSGTEPGSK